MDNTDILQSLSLNTASDESVLVEVLRKVYADKQYQVLAYILQILQQLPKGAIDEFGNNILHVVIMRLDSFGGLKFLEQLLKKRGARGLIDAYSGRDGFTPAILACTLNRNDVIKLLEDAGANIRLKARNGAMLVTDTTQQDGSLSVSLRGDGRSDRQKMSDSVVSALDKFLDPLRSAGREASALLKSSPNVDTRLSANKEEMSTDTFIRNAIQRLPREQRHMGSSLNQMGGSQMSDSQISDNQFGGKSSHSVVVGQRLLNMGPEFSPLSGGSSERKKKKRSKKKSLSPKKPAFSKKSLSPRKSLSPKKSRSSKKKPAKGSIELGRITDDIHERTVETIKSLMGVDDETARAYKSILYFRAKDRNPQATSYERAVEMEKLATKSELKEISSSELEQSKERRAKLKSESASSKVSSEKKPRKGKMSSDIDTLSTNISSEKPKRKVKKSGGKDSTSSPELDTSLSV